MLIEQYGPERVMDALYEYFRDNGGETGFVHSKDVAEAEKEIKRYVAFRTGRVAELAKQRSPASAPASGSPMQRRKRCESDSYGIGKCVESRREHLAFRYIPRVTRSGQIAAGSY